MRRSGRIAAALLVGALFGAPAHAGEPADPFARLERQLEALLGPDAVLGAVVTRQDLDRLLAHLRASILAAAAGREAPPADALDQRANEIADALRARGTLAALLLLDAIEAHVRQQLPPVPRREPLPPPENRITPIRY